MIAADLTQTIKAFLAKHPAKRLGVAVSGGGDSVAMLRLVADVFDPEMLFVATVDHGLRPESAAEAGFVAQICAQLGVAHSVLRWQGWDGAGNLQNQARRARYKLLSGWAQAHNLDAVALGHTQDDVAETFLLRLSREAGLDGLAAMPAVFTTHTTRFFRPLLGSSRGNLRAYCAEIDQSWVDDPSNDDPRFDRVKMRQALLALADAGLDAHAIAQSAQHLESARDATAIDLHRQASEIIRQDLNDLWIDPAGFAKLHPEHQRRLVNAALIWVSGAPYGPRAAALGQAIAAMLDGQSTTLHGCVLRAAPDQLHICREHAAVAQKRGPVADVWDGKWRLEGPQGKKTYIIAALGEDGLRQCPDWKSQNRPRATLLGSPAIWDGKQLISAPLAENDPQWRAKLAGNAKEFLTSLLSR